MSLQNRQSCFRKYVVSRAVRLGIGATLIAVGVLLWVGQLVRRAESGPVAFAQHVERIEIRVGSGSVHVTGTEGEAVSGSRTIRFSWMRPSAREWIDGATLHIEAGCRSLGPPCGGDYRPAVARGGALGGRAGSGFGG